MRFNRELRAEAACPIVGAVSKFTRPWARGSANLAGLGEAVLDLAEPLTAASSSGSG